MIEIVAKLNNVRHSPRKVRTVANEYKQMPLSVLRERLVFSRKKAASYILKAVNSAVANATNNLNLREDELTLASLVVGEGRRIRKPKYRARGRMDMTLTRYSNIRVVLMAPGNEKVGKGTKEVAVEKSAEPKTKLVEVKKDKHDSTKEKVKPIREKKTKVTEKEAK